MEFNFGESIGGNRFSAFTTQETRELRCLVSRASKKFVFVIPAIQSLEVFYEQSIEQKYHSKIKYKNLIIRLEIESV